MIYCLFIDRSDVDDEVICTVKASLNHVDLFLLLIHCFVMFLSNLLYFVFHPFLSDLSNSLTKCSIFEILSLPLFPSSAHCFLFLYRISSTNHLSFTVEKNEIERMKDLKDNDEWKMEKFENFQCVNKNLLSLLKRITSKAEKEKRKKKNYFFFVLSLTYSLALSLSYFIIHILLHFLTLLLAVVYCESVFIAFVFTWCFCLFLKSMSLIFFIDNFVFD